MEAKLQVHGDVTVVRLSGKIDIENSQNFTEICRRTFRRKKVVFCLNGLQFVGSSGIQTFFRALGELHTGSPHGIRLASVNADFQRMLRYTSEEAPLPIHENVETAVHSYLLADLKIEESQTPEVGSGERTS